MSRARNPGKTRTRKRALSQDVSTARQLFAGTKLTVTLCILLAAATIALYAPAIGYPFIVLDDSDYVTANAHIHGGLSWSTIKWSLTSTAAANWHPLTWLSHAFDFQLFALNPAGHHFDSILIHALNAVLLFLLLRWITGRIAPSLLVAALFAVHPLNVESVAWVAERKNVLSTLFFLLAIAAYAWYAQKVSWRRYTLVALLFAMGLMAKPMVITLPFVLLLLDYWPLGRMIGGPASVLRAQQTTFTRLVLEKIPLLVLSAASAVITVKVQHSGFAVRTLQAFPLAIRIENAIVAYGLYLWKVFWPAHLALYPHSAIAIPAWQWIFFALCLIGVTAVVVVLRRHPYLPVGWLWFLGTLVTVIGLVQVGQGAMADRYAYLPLIGIFVIVAFGLDDVANANHIGFTWRLIPALCVLLALSLVTHRQMAYWDSDYDLWAHTLAVAENPFAHDAMGSALLDPDLAITAANRDNLDTSEKRLQHARQHFERALEMRRQLAQQNPAVYLPDMATTLNNLGNLDRLQRRPDDARRHYEQALQIHRQLEQQNQEPFPPDMATTLANLAALEQSNGQLEQARLHFAAALEIYRRMAAQNPSAYLPKVAATLNTLALADREQKLMDAARLHYQEALTIRRQLAEQDADAYLPYLATTLNDLGILDVVQDRGAEARSHYEEALRAYRQLAQRDPSLYLPYLAATLNNLALLDEREGRIAEARAHFQEDLLLFRKLSQSDPEKYAGDVERVEASLAELEPTR